MQPYSQPLLWRGAPASTSNALINWYNGVPEPGIKRIATPTGGVKYWFNGGMAPTVFK